MNFVLKMMHSDFSEGCGGLGKQIGVYIVEDDNTLRDDFSLAVLASPSLRLIGATGSARAALSWLEGGGQLDVLLVDLGLPDGDGISVIRTLHRVAPQAKALVISVFADEWRVLNALAAGAQGYLLKDATDDELTQAILEVARGEAPLSPAVARYLLRMFDTRDAAPKRRPSNEQLTLRETQVLTLVSQGQSGPEVATHLRLSLHTVNTHLRNCHSKLAVKNRVQAVNRARDSGQIG